jgi:DNA-binding NtrC family response regulator
MCREEAGKLFRRTGSVFRLLVVDDDESYLLATKIFLEENGFSVDLARSGDEAIEKVRGNKFHYALVVLDYKMSGKDGAATARALCTINPDIFILTRSGDDSQAAAINAYDGGSKKFISKSAGRESFLEEVKLWCNKYQETHLPISEISENHEGQKFLSSLGIVGASLPMIEIGKKIIKISNSDLGALIRGESGAGKEVIAHAIHKTSKRKNGPFVKLNSGAVAENLIESELFGHEKGAFTGAIQKKDGLFLKANEGTFFLDEVADASPGLQVKLLRVIQEGIFTPVGSNREIRVNVRVIAATNRDLEQMIESGKFREDLFYRLKGVEFVIPPLRDRQEDIELLVAFFCKKWSSENGGIEKTFLKRTIDRMKLHSWPGNVRELGHMVQGLLTLSERMKIAPEDLPPEFFPHQENDEEEQTTLKEVVEKAEKERITSVYRASSSLRDAGEKLGISPANLLRKLRKYGISKDFRGTLN